MYKNITFGQNGFTMILANSGQHGINDQLTWVNWDLSQTGPDDQGCMKDGDQPTGGVGITGHG